VLTFVSEAEYQAGASIIASAAGVSLLIIASAVGVSFSIMASSVGVSFSIIASSVGASFFIISSSFGADAPPQAVIRNAAVKNILERICLVFMFLLFLLVDVRMIKGGHYRRRTQSLQKDEPFPSSRKNFLISSP